MALVVLSSSGARAQQVVDTAFAPRGHARPAFERGRGPAVVIDEAHHNFHTAGGRYRPFARLVEGDGYVVSANRARIDSASLGAARVLVIANAVSERQAPQPAWRLPAIPAFDSAEIAAVVAWVRRGGGLLLIADHMPFAGAVEGLARALGVYFVNGFAIPPFGPDPRTGDYPIVFRRGDGSLGSHPITNGRTVAERVDSIVSFTGAAFRLAPAVSSRATLMVLPRGTRVRLPVQAWQFSDSTPEIAGDELTQGAAFLLGEGRVAVFGEAAMFTAQLKGPSRVAMGVNAAEAAQNARFVLNTVRWLADRK